MTMSHSHDDSRLTALALGELESPEREALQTQVDACEACRREVEAVRAAAGTLSRELSGEPGPGLEPRQRQAIERGLKKPLVPPIFLKLKAAAILVLVGLAGLLALAAMPTLHKSKGNAAALRRLSASSPLHGANPGICFNQPLDHPQEAGYGFRMYEGDSGHLTETYDLIVDNAFQRVADHPLSTFSIDVDTASYSNLRRFLKEGQRPPKDAVRIEEMLNYFRYDYPEPKGEAPFSVTPEVSACPWAPTHRLLRIGLKGREIDLSRRPPSNLVFLVDVSGSMEEANKLFLLQRALPLLVEQLGENDRVAIAVYASQEGLVLPSTRCDAEGKRAILASLGNLHAGGSTNGGAGIQLAYRVAAEHFIPGGTNRVIWCTDGDLNVGVTDQGGLTRLIEDKAKTGVFLTALGLGTGNLKDSTLEQVADKGNGQYAYIDTLNEGRKVLVEQMAGTLITIAKDVKLQLEFNPAKVGAYRLIGYENRLLNKEDFNDDRKDAGEIGAGHTVTALYEIVPAGVPLDLPGVDPLKYQKPVAVAVNPSPELLTVKLRYKEPAGETSKLLELPVLDKDLGLDKASGDFRFAAAVASFGMLLRDSGHKGNLTYGSLLEELAGGDMGRDEGGYRREFVDLVKAAQRLKEKAP
jgi:Ca-activated chloride channel family protein